MKCFLHFSSLQFNRSRSGKVLHLKGKLPDRHNANTLFCCAVTGPQNIHIEQFVLVPSWSKVCGILWRFDVFIIAPCSMTKAAPFRSDPRERREFTLRIKSWICLVKIWLVVWCTRSKRYALPEAKKPLVFHTSVRNCCSNETGVAATWFVGWIIKSVGSNSFQCLRDRFSKQPVGTRRSGNWELEWLSARRELTKSKGRKHGTFYLQTHCENLVLHSKEHTRFSAVWSPRFWISGYCTKWRIQGQF